MKRIFISFDHEHDQQHWQVLSALKAHSSSAIEFEDITPEEMQSKDVERVKAVLTDKIGRWTHTLVMLDRYDNNSHPKSHLIGERNWQWWKIKRSIEEMKKLVVVKAEVSSTTPEPLFGVGVKWSLRFTVPAILQAINEALLS